MKVHILASGSAGNATCIEMGGSRFLYNFSVSLPGNHGYGLTVVFLLNEQIDIIVNSCFPAYKCVNAPTAVQKHLYRCFRQHFKNLTCIKISDHKIRIYRFLINDKSPLDKALKLRSIFSMSQSHHFSCSRKAMNSSSKRILTTRQGFPTATAYGGMSEATTELAPIIAPSPM